MSNSGEEKTPKTQPSYSGGPPRPPKMTARDLQDQPNPRKNIFLPDPVAVRDLAIALHLKPFKVVADLLELKLLKSADDLLDFETAAKVARMHGFRAERPPPGMLVL